ncbi:hypothetical protein JZ751_024070, partial [Albula glossodonta]
MHHYITMDTTVTVIINVRKKLNVCFIFSEVNVLLNMTVSQYLPAYSACLMLCCAVMAPSIVYIDDKINE